VQVQQRLDEMGDPRAQPTASTSLTGSGAARLDDSSATSGVRTGRAWTCPASVTGEHGLRLAVAEAAQLKLGTEGSGRSSITL
jgi:hypothetical protein